MIKKISELIAESMVLHTKLQEDREIYVYGLQIILNTIISLGIVLIAGYWLHIFCETLLFLFCYCSIRLFAGGFHASSNEKCIGTFILGYLVIIFILFNVNKITNLYLILILCLINTIIAMWAPVEAYNNPIPKWKKNRMKKKSFFISLIITIVILHVLQLNFKIGIWGFAGLCWFGFIFIIGKIKNDFLRRTLS